MNSKRRLRKPKGNYCDLTFKCSYKTHTSHNGCVVY
uniref:Uncharacterized protein n=1 Tax=Arundo donax TaxID=35708 RepID=A0A0A8YU79_ARUDO